MLFNSYEFLLYFPIVTIIYGIIPKQARKYWLLVASYYFYMQWNPYYISLILISTVLTYVGGRYIGSHREDIKKAKACKNTLIAVLIANLAILFVFKYTNWVLDMINGVTGAEMSLPVSIVLPVGISFYTFQALGYIIDVYRGDTVAEKNFITYALFVSFFPQLVAGPIERSKNLLTQIQSMDKIKMWNYDRIVKGLITMLWGFFLKLVIADRVAIFVNTVFDNYYAYGTVELFLAAVGFSLQIYCDFASYSIIALGSAKVLGIELMENFNTPYFSRSIKEFWGRWHISLSGWFKDYVYIPLGGNRCSKPRHYLNLMITFLVSGLWHGANWTYVVWGAIHGIYQVIGIMLKPVKEAINKKLEINTKAASFAIGQILITSFLAMLAWIFFRANSLTQAVTYIGRMFTRYNPWVLYDGSIYNNGLDRTEILILIWACLALFIVSFIKRIANTTIDAFLMKQNLWFRWVVLFALIYSIVIYGVYGAGAGATQFIYFQF